MNAAEPTNTQDVNPHYNIEQLLQYMFKTLIFKNLPFGPLFNQCDRPPPLPFCPASMRRGIQLAALRLLRYCKSLISYTIHVQYCTVLYIAEFFSGQGGGS